MNLMALAVVVLATLCAAATAEEHHERVPSGFTGVRGKRSVPDSSYLNDDLKAVEGATSSDKDKRAPSGFVGMRGKKPDTWEGTYPEGLYIKRAPSGFMGMRGKKELFSNYGITPK